MSDPNSGPVQAVELAYPLVRDGQRYEPDAVVELPRDDARQLVQDGLARWAAPNKNTKAAPTKPARKE